VQIEKALTAATTKAEVEAAAKQLAESEVSKILAAAYAAGRQNTTSE
jgi:hypothetical protein